MTISGTRRGRNSKETKADQRTRYGRQGVVRGTIQEVKGFIDKVYHPGEEDEDGWNDNIVRVTVIVNDEDQDYNDQLKDVVLVLEENPSHVALHYGSDGLSGAPCLIRFAMPNVKNTARVYLQSVRNQKAETAVANNKDYLSSKSFSITSAILG